MARYVVIFFAAGVVIGIVYNGGTAFLASGEGLHGFERGMPAFVLGMSFWTLIVGGNAAGFAAAMHLNESRFLNGERQCGAIGAAVLGGCATIAGPILAAGTAIVALRSLPGTLLYFGGGGGVVSFMITICWLGLARTLWKERGEVSAKR